MSNFLFDFIFYPSSSKGFWGLHMQIGDITLKKYDIAKLGLQAMHADLMEALQKIEDALAAEYVVTFI